MEIEQKYRLDSNSKKYIQKISKQKAKTEAQQGQKQAFRIKQLHLLSFTASAKQIAKWPQNALWNDTQIIKFDTRGFPKAMPKTSIKIYTKQMQESDLVKT